MTHGLLRLNENLVLVPIWHRSQFGTKNVKMSIWHQECNRVNFAPVPIWHQYCKEVNLALSILSLNLSNCFKTFQLIKTFQTVNCPNYPVFRLNLRQNWEKGATLTSIWSWYLIIFYACIGLNMHLSSNSFEVDI